MDVFRAGVVICNNKYSQRILKAVCGCLLPLVIAVSCTTNFVSDLPVQGSSNNLVACTERKTSVAAKIAEADVIFIGDVEHRSLYESPYDYYTNACWIHFKVLETLKGPDEKMRLVRVFYEPYDQTKKSLKDVKSLTSCPLRADQRYLVSARVYPKEKKVKGYSYSAVGISKFMHCLPVLPAQIDSKEILEIRRNL